VAQPLRPLTISELFDRTFSLYRAHFLVFVGIAAIPVAATVVLQLLYEIFGLRSASLAVTLLSSLGIVALYLVASMVMQGATIVAVSQVHMGLETSIAEAFDGIRGRIGELVILALNVGLRVALGCVLLIIPGIYLLLRYALAVPAAVIEKTSISESLGRSADLTRGHIGRIFLIYVLFVMLTYAGTAVVQFPVLMVAVTSSVKLTDPPLWLRATSAVGAFVVNALVGPLMAIGLSMVYYDERVRKEGFDLEHMLEQLDPSELNAPRMA
jgi:hypothetical protein